MDVKNYLTSVAVFVSLIFTAQCQMFELSPLDMMQLQSAVRQIVHPNAQPTPEIMAIATRQGAPPTTIAQMLEYTPFLVNLAMQMGVRPPGSNGTVTHEALRNYIIARGNQWMQQQGALAGMTGGRMGLGTENTGFGGMGSALVPTRTATPVQPLGALSGQRMSAAPMGGFGFNPMSLMFLDGGLDIHPMTMMGSMGAGNPFSMMYLMQNM
ncbi:uncharacterized protein LOC132732036 [Ruditapes philippinarum]|uniref:uncharacterized protein LOC132732036 n=1 Tax=Ruditapes philippinarum TaxID=129788 RepID=UPI00295A6327|nr:uncharacterized protein LOC132732036 [Ruditapes philippinarum]